MSLNASSVSKALEGRLTVVDEGHSYGLNVVDIMSVASWDGDAFVEVDLIWV